ncbi:leucine-rich repeat-containing protein 15-like [Aethina tumida]|uniref:leucine-rich repeat-containing protein 15-like n=1 Tax=Aethina tumida TaxID=116153 RepID=UPI002149571D|nr:leucine-rich repeat-containing protein 15-like [Aethina tumida]
MLRMLVLSVLLTLVAADAGGCAKSKISYEIDNKKEESEVIRVTKSASQLNIIGPLKTICKGLLKIEAPVEELSYNGKDLEKIEPGAFDNQYITDKISIINSNLKVIKPYTFNKLNISSLQLGRNQIESIEENAIIDLPNLYDLQMPYNKIHSIPENAFKNLPLLRQIIISDNQLKALPKSWFTDFKSLEVLRLNNNKLTSLDQELFDHKKWFRLFVNENDLDCPTILKLRKLAGQSGYQKVRRKRGSIGDNPSIIGYDEKKC